MIKYDFKLHKTAIKHFLITDSLLYQPYHTATTIWCNQGYIALGRRKMVQVAINKIITTTPFLLTADNSTHINNLAAFYLLSLVMHIIKYGSINNNYTLKHRNI